MPSRRTGNRTVVDMCQDIPKTRLSGQARCNSTPLPNPSFCRDPLYIAIAFEKIIFFNSLGFSIYWWVEHVGQFSVSTVHLIMGAFQNF